MAFKQDKPEDCPVCYESINSQKEALECGHWVHTECIVKSTKAQCPICRRSLVLNPKDIESLDLKYKREIIEKAQRNLLGHSTQMSSSSSSHYMERKKIDYSITTYSEKLAKFQQEVDPLVRLLAELAEAAAKFSTAKARIFPVRGDGNPLVYLYDGGELDTLHREFKALYEKWKVESAEVVWQIRINV